MEYAVVSSMVFVQELFLHLYIFIICSFLLKQSVVGARFTNFAVFDEVAESKKILRILRNEERRQPLTCSQHPESLTADVRWLLLSDFSLPGLELPEQPSRSSCQVQKWPMPASAFDRANQQISLTSSNNSTFGLRRSARAIAIRSVGNRISHCHGTPTRIKYAFDHPKVVSPCRPLQYRNR